MQRVSGTHRAHACGLLPADGPPHPVALLGVELYAPFAVHLNGRAVRVADGEANQRQRDDFLARRAQSDALVGQKARRAGCQLVDQGGRIRRDDLHRVERGSWPIGLNGQPRLDPHVMVFQVLCAEQAAGCSLAAVFSIALRVPVAPHLVGLLCIERRVFDVLDQHRVATHLAVVVHAVVGQLIRKSAPVAALTEQHQPVVAQPVFHIGAGKARVKILHLLRRGFAQARFQVPVGGPRFQRVAAHGRQQLRQPRLVATLESLAQLQHFLVASGSARVGLR